MKKSNVYQYFTQDLISEILDLAKSHQEFQQLEPSEFNDGYNFAMYHIISTIFSQAKIFQLDLKELGLENIDPEYDLLFKNLAKNQNFSLKK